MIKTHDGVSPVLLELMRMAYDIAERHGFAEVPDELTNLKTPEAQKFLADAMKAQRLALRHSEISEELEAIRKPGPDDKLPEFNNAETEWADQFIRWADDGYREGYDPAVVLAKMAFNETRPHKHGKDF